MGTLVPPSAEDTLLINGPSGVKSAVVDPNVCVIRPDGNVPGGIGPPQVDFYTGVTRFHADVNAIGQVTVNGQPVDGFPVLVFKSGLLLREGSDYDWIGNPIVTVQFHSWVAGEFVAVVARGVGGGG